MNKSNSVLSISTYNEGMQRGKGAFEIEQGLTATRFEDVVSDADYFGFSTFHVLKYIPD